MTTRTRNAKAMRLLFLIALQYTHIPCRVAERRSQDRVPKLMGISGVAALRADRRPLGESWDAHPVGGSSESRFSVAPSVDRTLPVNLPECDFRLRRPALKQIGRQCLVRQMIAEDDSGRPASLLRAR